MFKKWIFILIIILLTGCSAQPDPWVFTGSIEADEIDVSSEVSGKIKAVLVKEGDFVEKGDLLIELDTEDYRLKLAILENAKAMAELNYIDLKDGHSKNQIRSARANVTQVEAQIQGSRTEQVYLQKNVEDAQALFNAGAISENELDQAQRLLEREESKLANLTSQREAYLAQLDLVEEGATDEAEESARLLVEQKSLEIEDLKRTIEKSSLVAPVSGYVQNVNYQLGEWVSPGRKVVTVIDTSQSWVKIYIPEKQLSGVYLGQRVIFLDSFLDGTGVEGKVAFISSKAEFTPKNIESKENKQEMVFETRILVDDPSDTVKPGMFLDIRLAGD